MSNKKYLRNIVSSAVILGLNSTMVIAAETPTLEKSEENIEKISILGSRVSGRTLIDSPVPVDSFDAESLRSQGSSDMSDVLTNLVPSFNVSQQPISDGSSFVRPISLRGMAPDHTLVLINGKRSHRAALVHLTPGSGAQGRGTQGADIANIPSIALSRVDVLRDGAAAQYGSDAIAGVVNFVLREDSEGLDVNLQYGHFYEGENEYKLSSNLGLPLGDDGFLNLSLELTGSDELSRGVQHNDAVAILEADPSLASYIDSPAQVWGRPESESIRTYWNGASPSSEGEIYFSGNYAELESTGSFFYRPPTGVVAGVGNTGVFGRDADGNCIQFCDLFPGGFTPRFTGNLTDFSQVVGYRQYFDNDLSLDFSYNYGSNKLDYELNNSVNPALGDNGVNTQTTFDVGALEERDESLNIDLSKPFFHDEVNIAVGFEWRKETYEITAGERASWDGNAELSVQGFAVGSSGFGGFTPETAGEFSRENIAAYADVEWDISDDLLITAAVRYEDFTDFGSTVNSKVAARYNLTDNFVIRAAASTGFKAPTVGQSSTSQVSTQFFDDGSGNLIQSQVATLRVNDPVSVIMGAVPLDAEDSESLSAGITYSGDLFTLAVDYYSIDVDDRIGLTTQLTPTTEQAAEIKALNLNQNFSRVAYFTNAFSTETQGIDVIATYNFTEDTKASLGYGWNDTKVKNADIRVVNRERGLELQDGLPEHKGNLTILHNADKWHFMARVNYFGEVLDASSVEANDELAGAEITVDAEASFDYSDNISISIGATNLFDEYPDLTKLTSGPVNTGLQYFRQSPVGYNGGEVYLRLNTSF
jgi:iron complex outermembrane receptor protein